VNGVRGKAPLRIDAVVGTPVALEADGTRDPDSNRLKYSWVLYSEAGTGIPGQPVTAAGLVPVGGGGDSNTGGIPSADQGGPPQPPPRVTLQTGATPTAVAATPRVAGTAHIILIVEDDGAPSLTSYRRVILNIRPAAK
jgi:hypothetical protein